MPRHFAKVYDLVFKQWDDLFYLIMLFTCNTLERVKRKTLSFADHLVLVSSFVLVIEGERIIQR